MEPIVYTYDEAYQASLEYFKGDELAVPEIDEHGIIPYYIDKEQHCMCVVCTLCGLRAPPAYVA